MKVGCRQDRQGEEGWLEKDLQMGPSGWLAVWNSGLWVGGKILSRSPSNSRYLQSFTFLHLPEIPSCLVFSWVSSPSVFFSRGVTNTGEWVAEYLFGGGGADSYGDSPFLASSVRLSEVGVRKCSINSNLTTCKELLFLSRSYLCNLFGNQSCHISSRYMELIFKSINPLIPSLGILLPGFHGDS